jgi:rod shape-determining protein MreC
VRDTRRTRLALAGLLIAALGLMGLSAQGSSGSVIAALRTAAGSVAGGAERAAAAVAGPLVGFVSSGVAGVHSRADVAALQRQLVRLRGQLSAARLSRADYAQLRRVLRLAGAGGYRVVAASAIAAGPGFQQTVTLNAGTAEGIRPQQTVLDAGGLVGQVITASRDTSTVLLATDARSVVGIRLAPRGQLGWVTGAGSGDLLSLQVLSATAPLHRGEQLVTEASVHDRPFVPGVPVGVITAVLHRPGSLTERALVRPYAAFGALDVVGVVVTAPRQGPGFALLPVHRPATAAGVPLPGPGR